MRATALARLTRFLLECWLNHAPRGGQRHRGVGGQFDIAGGCGGSRSGVLGVLGVPDRDPDLNRLAGLRGVDAARAALHPPYTIFG